MMATIHFARSLNSFASKIRISFFLLSPKKGFDSNQGDQIWRISAYWAIVFFGHFLKIFRK
jgi:hypothetical protein